MENPFTFDTTNPRLVTKVVREDINFSDKNTYIATGAIYAASVVGFQRRYMRTNAVNGGQAALFFALSLPTAYVYARYFTNSANNEAAVFNNLSEAALTAPKED